MVAPEVITTIKGLLIVLEEANRCLMTKTDKHNRKLSNSLQAFLFRLQGECVEGRVPSDEWLWDLNKLSDDINNHLVIFERHEAQTGSLVLFKSVLDNARAKKLRKDVEQLRESMSFVATPASTPTTS